MNYEKQGRDFLEKTGTKMTAVFLKNAKYWPQDKEKRDIYQIILSRGSKGFSFGFGTSITDTEQNARRGIKLPPSAYSVLACLQKNEPPESLNEFCAEYGFEGDDHEEAIRSHTATREEWKNVSELFTPEEIEELQKIA